MNSFLTAYFSNTYSVSIISIDKANPVLSNIALIGMLWFWKQLKTRISLFLETSWA